MTLPARKARLEKIDVIRGLAISAVVAGHADSPLWVNGFLKDIALPVFFFVSGYLFSSSKHMHDPKRLAAARFRSLLVPYFSAAALSCLVWFVTMYTGDVKDGILWYKPVVGMFYGNDPGGWLGLNGPLWFLVCLFCAQMLFGSALTFLRNVSHWGQAGVFLLLGLSGYGIGRLVFLPWGLDIALASLPFLFAGHLCRQQGMLDKIKPLGWPALLSAAAYTAAAWYNAPDMNFRDYGNVFLFYAAGLSGSMALLALVNALGRIKLLLRLFALLGRESLAILMFHYGFVFVALRFADKRWFGLSLHWTVYLALGILVPVLVSLAIRQVPVLNLLFNGTKIDKRKTGERRVLDGIIQG